MSFILKCNNPNCSVSLFKADSQSHKSKCPICKNTDLTRIEFKQGVDEFICSNPHCIKYQVNPLVTNKFIFICPFCQKRRIDIIKHDIK